jgi:hypothetical protein
VAVDDTRVGFMRLEVLHTVWPKTVILQRLGSFSLLVIALLLGDRNSVDRDGTVFSLEVGDLFGAKY